MSKKFKIGLVTVNRSDFGIQKELIKKLEKNNKIDFSLVVTGTHFDKKYGYTVDEIKKENIAIDSKFKNHLNGDNSLNVGRNFSKYINFFSKIFKKKKFDNIIILGDRFEMIAAAIVSRIFNISISHIHGGEITLGAQDEYFRHAISKLSNIHFVSLQEYKTRLIKMGEQPKSIIISGAPSLENINSNKFLGKNELKKKFGINFKKYNFLLTFHPETLNPKENVKDFKIILNTVKTFINCQFILTSPAPDINSLKMIKLLNKKYKNINYIKSLGRNGYFSLLKVCNGMIGNSSSGIIEAASFGKFVINLGSRQKGRVQSQNVLNCKCNKLQLIKSINKLKKFKTNKNIKNIYYKKNSSQIIISSIIKYLKSNQNKTFKNFYNFK